MIRELLWAGSAVIGMMTVGLSAPYIDNLPDESVPFCTYEDGNEDGNPCIWVDPDTGDMYWQDSENYRDRWDVPR